MGFVPPLTSLNTEAPPRFISAELRHCRELWGRFSAIFADAAGRSQKRRAANAARPEVEASRLLPVDQSVGRLRTVVRAAVVRIVGVAVTVRRRRIVVSRRCRVVVGVIVARGDRSARQGTGEGAQREGRTIVVVAVMVVVPRARVGGGRREDTGRGERRDGGRSAHSTLQDAAHCKPPFKPTVNVLMSR